jgi:hypothetical protein
VEQDKKRRLETNLMRTGLAAIKEQGALSGEFVQVVADIVNSWQGSYDRLGEWIGQHEFVRDLLNECNVSDRGEMYNCVIPKLKFKPKSLIEYETMIAQKVDRFASRRKVRITGEREKPIQVGDQKITLAKPGEGNLGWCMLQCHQCVRIEKYLGATPVDAMYKARNAGWRRNVTLEHELCPDCAKKPMIIQKEGRA